MKKTHSLASSAAVMGVIILLSKVAGLLRDILIAANFGTTEAAVAYETASRLPVTIFDFVLGGVVTAAFIPIYSSLSVREGRKEALSFAHAYLRLILLVTGTLTVCGVVFAPALVHFMAPELGGATAALAVDLTRWMFPMVICVGLAFTFVGFLQSEGEYNIPAVISLVSNLIMVGYLLFFADRFGVRGLSWAMLLGWAAQAAVQIPAVLRHGFIQKGCTAQSLFSPDIRRALKNTLPILLSTWVTPMCNLINTRLASGMEGGRAINALGYANRLYIILVGIFSFVATNLLFPLFSRAAAQGRTEESDRLSRISIRMLVFILAPLAVGLMVLAEPFISLVYEYGSFTPSDTAITAEALRFYAVGMPFSAVAEVLTKAFFATEDTRLPMISAFTAMGFNIGILLLFGEKLGIGGIALISGLTAGVNMLVNLLFAIRKKRLTPDRHDVRSTLTSLLCAAGMGAAVYAVSVLSRSVVNGRILSFALPVLCGVLVYALLAVLLRQEEMLSLLRTLGRRVSHSDKQAGGPHA